MLSGEAWKKSCSKQNLGAGWDLAWSLDAHPWYPQPHASPPLCRAAVGAGDAAGPSGRWQPDAPRLSCSSSRSPQTSGRRLRSPLHPLRGRSRVLGGIWPQQASAGGLQSLARPFGSPPPPAGADGRTAVNFTLYSECWVAFIVKAQILILMRSLSASPEVLFTSAAFFANCADSFS